MFRFLCLALLLFQRSELTDGSMTSHHDVHVGACSVSDSLSGPSLLQAKFGELLRLTEQDRRERIKFDARNRSAEDQLALAELAKELSRKEPSSSELCWVPPKLDADGGWTDPNYTATWVPPDAACPADCPFSQALSEEQCYKACVRAEHCKALHPFRTFADVTTLECSSTCGLEAEDMIVGCNDCESVGVCHRCSVFRVMKDAGRECKDDWKYLWRAVYWICTALLLMFTLWLFFLQVRPVSNPGMLAHGNVFRQLSIPWQTRLSQDNDTVAVRKYVISARSDKDDICGLGAALYFRWMQFLVMAVAVLLSVNVVVYHVAIEMVLSSAPSEIISRSGFGGFNWDILEPQKCIVDVATPQRDQNTTSAGLVEEQDLTVLVVGRGRRKPRVRSMKKLKLKVKAKPKIRPKTGSSGRDEAGDRPAGDPDVFPRRMAVSMVLSYAFLTASSLVFVLRQKQFADGWKQEKRQHSDFAVVAKGFPPDATEPGELRDFFQNALDRASALDGAAPADASELEVVGVSIGYGYGEHAKFIEMALDWVVEHIDANSTLNDWTRTTSAGKLSDSSGGRRSSSNPDSSGNSEDEQSSSNLPGETSFPAVVRRMSSDLSVMFAHSGKRNDMPGWKSKLRSLLSQLENTGHVVVVASSELARERLLNMPLNLRAFHGVPLDMRATTAEPPTVAWQSFGHQRSTARMVKHFGVLLSTIVLWAAFYVPYAVYNMTAMAVPGAEVGEAEDFVLGLLIAVGNQLVNFVIERSVEQMGFWERERKEALTMVLTFIATIINTFCDIGIVFLVMRGVSLQFALHGTLDESHYDRVLARELFALVVPGYLVTPYLISPFFEDILPWYISTRSVRTNDKIKASEAERKMACPESDVYSRYSDILTNFTICLCLLTFETPYIYLILGWLFISFAVMYVVDHYRLLRMASVTHHLSEELSMAFSYWWAVPTGFFASISMFWVIEAQMLQPNGAENSYMLLAFLLHILLYCLLTRRLRRPSTVTSTRSTYLEMCRRNIQEVRLYDYFNTNPILVLRSWFLKSQEPVSGGLVPYIRGKEYLQLEGGVTALLRSAEDSGEDFPEVEIARSVLQCRAEKVRAVIAAGSLF